jgi:CTP:molybdopterin cytidylyltransferase MocA
MPNVGAVILAAGGSSRLGRPKHGTLGVPALFHRSCADELLRLDEGSGAKVVISLNHDRVAEFPFPEGKIDIDTATDYDRLHVSQDQTT